MRFRNGKQWLPYLVATVSIVLGADQLRPQAVDRAEVVIPPPQLEGLEAGVAELLQEAHTSAVAALEPLATLSAEERGGVLGYAGEVFQANGAVDSALASYEQAVAIDAESARWKYLLGYMLKNQGTLERALELLTASNELSPNPFTLFRIAEVHLANGDLESARSLLGELSTTQGMEAAVAAALGRSSLLEGDYTSACDRFLHALELQPQAATIRFSLAQAYRGLGDLEKARQQAELAGPGAIRVQDPILQQVGERSASSETYVSMGAQALKSGQTGLARRAYEKALDLNPQNKRAMVNLGALALETGDPESARRYFEDALALDPDYGFAHFNLAELLIASGESDAALHHYREAVAANPKSVPFRTTYADHLLRLERFTDAAEQYQKIADETPDSARPHYLRSLALVAVGDLKSALASVAIARDLNPDDPATINAFIRLASTAPNVDAALRAEALQVARELFTRSNATEEAELLAMALAANGAFEQAVRLQSQITTAFSSAQVPEHVRVFAEANLARYQDSLQAARPWP